MDKQTYISNNAWKGNPFLIQPETAVKKCQCCEENKYSSEFPDYDHKLFLDGKLPVCITCFRMSDDAGRNMVKLTGITIACKACGVFQTLDRYSYSKPTNTLRTACRACGSKVFKRIKNEDK
jgi:hypothetical protein